MKKLTCKKANILAIKYIISIIPRIILQYLYSRGVLKRYLWDGISKREKKGILIYATFIPIFFPYDLAKISKSGLTREKKEIITLIGALTLVNDKFIDSVNDERINFENIINEETNDNLVKFQANLLERIYEINDSRALRESFKRISDAQINSINQKRTKDTKKLMRILSDKGGYSGQLYAQAVINQCDEKIMKAMYQFGFWLQLLDDLTDIQEDIDEGVNTLATLSSDYDDYVNYVYAKKKEAFSSIKSLKIPETKKIDFIYSAHFFTEIAVIFYTGEIKIKGKSSNEKNVFEKIIQTWQRVRFLEY